MTAWLDPVREALDRAPAPVTLFFRDDDAGWRDDRLLALLDRFDDVCLPIDLALIPSEIGPESAAALASRVDSSGGRLGLHQHGFAHANHEPEGRKCEFGPSRSACGSASRHRHRPSPNGLAARNARWTDLHAALEPMHEGHGGVPGGAGVRGALEGIRCHAP